MLRLQVFKVLDKRIRPGILHETTINIWRTYFDDRSRPHSLYVADVEGDTNFRLVVIPLREEENERFTMVYVRVEGILLIFPPTVYNKLMDYLPTPESFFEIYSIPHRPVLKLRVMTPIQIR